MIRIVCLGAGYTNVLGSAEIKRQLPDANVTLVNRTHHYTYPHALREIVAGRARPDDVRINLITFCREHHITFLEANVEHIDRIERIVHANGQRIPYDILILDLAPEPVVDVDGAARAIRVGGVSAAIALRTHLITELRHARDTNNPKHRSVAVVGNGAEGIELVTGVHELLGTLCREHCIFPSELDHIIIPASRTDDKLPENAKKKARQILEDEGIEWYESEAHAFRKDGVVLPDRVIETHTIVWTADHHGHPLLAAIGVELDPHGHVTVDDTMQTTDPRIFAAGGSAASKTNNVHYGRWTAEQERHAIVHNVIALANHRPVKRFVIAPKNPVLSFGKGKGLLASSKYSWYGRFPMWLRERRLRAYDKNA